MNVFTIIYKLTLDVFQNHYSVLQNAKLFLTVKFTPIFQSVISIQNLNVLNYWAILIYLFTYTNIQFLLVKMKTKNGQLWFRAVASAQNIDISSGTHERIGVFKISANIGSHFKISHKNIDKNIKCLYYWYFECSFYRYFEHSKYWYFERGTF